MNRASVALLITLGLAGCTPVEPAPDPYHPVGYAAPSNHAAPFKLQAEDCRPCHGDDLAGGLWSAQPAVSCDDCHDAGWREDCTFCHGGELSDDGAPPRDIAATEAISFPPHPAHGASDAHAEWDCTQCHVQPTDVLSAGHTMDDTPGVAELAFAAGQAPDTTWDGAGCSNNACHGDGQDAGAVVLEDAPLDCGSCHPAPGTPAPDQAGMSGDHRQHAMHGVLCSDCHSNVNEAGEIIDPATHVDLSPTISMPTITIDAGHCTGRCHEFDHFSISW